ncbi:cell division protein FtsZ [Candidatus Dependentiae bacterium]|nr:cell division protein FtsZ [Candidatus Dependentiae bacterium]MBU4386922.1 cell division protein FtsZ [Candidatus Dependentiae bacterium]MCG2756399.1 cell division protein FtsZ [Candidatus Dependentiae bacterium]
MIQLAVEEKNENLGANLKVLGIGGAGGNAVNSMINCGELERVEFLVANTDAQALNMSLANEKLQLGAKITKGLGAGAKPEVGKRAAEEDLDFILEKISSSDILFLTAGLGGGTGSGALPVIAKSAKDMGILTVAVVATPFNFEGNRRLLHAQEAIKNLQGAVDTLIIVPNQKLLETADPKISMLNAFAMSDDVLKNAVKGISDIITKSGHINVDFADVKEVMKDMGMAIMGIGRADGEGRAKNAVLKAINSPLLEDMSIKGAKGVLINITGNTDLGLQEINEAATLIHDMVSPDAQIILGSVIDPSIGNEIMITVIATGFETKPQDFKPAVKDQQKQQVANFKQEINQVNSINLEEPKIEENIEDIDFKITPSNISMQSFDLQDLDTPTFLRKKAEEDTFRKMQEKDESNDNLVNI